MLLCGCQRAAAPNSQAVFVGGRVWSAEHMVELCCVMKKKSCDTASLFMVVQVHDRYSKRSYDTFPLFTVSTGTEYSILYLYIPQTKERCHKIFYCIMYLYNHEQRGFITRSFTVYNHEKKAVSRDLLLYSTMKKRLYHKICYCIHILHTFILYPMDIPYPTHIYPISH